MGAELFPKAEPDIAAAVLRYLVSLGLLSATDAPDTFAATTLGRTVLGRWGGFALLHSYEEMFRSIGAMLAGEQAAPPVNRARNIAGSGQLHVRKYFPAAVERLRASGAATLVDVGCGDGTWLEHAARAQPLAALAGVDFSSMAVETAGVRMQEAGWPLSVALKCDGLAVEQWAPAVAELPKPLVVSLWFVVHEFSSGSTERVADFFHRLHRALPDAEVLLGEVVAVEPSVLAVHHARSILPEYQLFHALSGQGLLDWGQFAELRKVLPYDVVFEKEWDTLPLTQGGDVPSNVLWHLKPRL